MKTLFSIIFLSILAGFYGCGNSGSTADNPNPGYGGSYFPKYGTTYTYHSYLTDSMGMKVPDSDTDYTATVTLSGATYMGKSNVFQVDDNGTKNYYTYESNGDVDVFLDQSTFGLFSAFVGSAFNQWFTFPTSSHIKGLIVYDSTITLPVIGDIPIIGRINYVGQEDITVGAETFKAEKCALLIDGAPLVKFEQYFWFVKKIGYFAKRTSSTTLLSIPLVSPGITSGDFQILTSYSLK